MDDRHKCGCGVLDRLAPSPLWYRLGAESACPRTVLEPDGDWRKYPILHEFQAKSGETMSCVSFSAANAVETHLKRLGVDANFSDRALASMSGTTPDGNYCDRVADVIRNMGLAPEAVWPYPAGMGITDFLAPVPAAVQQEAKLFLNDWQVSYEYVWEQGQGFAEALKYGPVQVVLDHHAMLLVHIDPTTGVRTVRDHYSRPLRELPNGTTFRYGLLYHVARRNPMPTFKLMPNTLYQLVEPPGGFGLALNEDTLITEQRWELLASWAVRGGGRFLTGTLTRAQWDSAGKRDLKGNAI